MNLEDSILIAEIFSCWFMTGLIWLVQVVVYPNFLNVPDSAFEKFHSFHAKRITWVVGPVMLVELVSAVALYLFSAELWYAWNLALVVAIWIVTGAVSVPIHGRVHSNSSDWKKRLVWTNWLRTTLWSARAIGWIFFCAAMK